MKENRVLTIDNLTTTFESHKQKIQAVRGVSLHVDEGDILAIVGESGSGKSVTMKSVMGLLGENADVQADHLELLQKDLLSYLPANNMDDPVLYPAGEIGEQAARLAAGLAEDRKSVV